MDEQDHYLTDRLRLFGRQLVNQLVEVSAIGGDSHTTSLVTQRMDGQ